MTDDTPSGCTATTDEAPQIRRIDIDDLREVLRQGFDDFYARPTNVIFLGVLYPAVAVILVGIAYGYDLLQLIFPLVSGFALVAPLAATGIYELSRRRERGEDDRLRHVLGVFRSPSLGGLLGMGGILAGLFLLWLWSALEIYALVFGSALPAGLPAFLGQVFGTTAGWALILIGCAVGFLFAAAAFAISVTSLPMLLDRKTSLQEAIGTSLRVCRRNPGTMIVWATIVAGGLLLGSLPLFIGLAIALPVLGHATWHLYRKTVIFP